MNVAQCLPLWSAFAELFLDTEVSADTHRYIARQLLASELSADILSNILWLEVFPALCDNLRGSAGEWAGFNEQWLQELILAVVNRQAAAYSALGLITVSQAVEIVEAEWRACCTYLPAPFFAAQRPSLRSIRRSGKRQLWRWS